jgi:uncharacterized repeat protein (TIGR01451 family)
MRLRLRRLLPMLLLIAAAPLTITKTSSIVSDPAGNLFPHPIPGAVVDYTITITNPLANSLTTVKTVSFQDAVPARTALRVSDLGLLPGSGPVVFTDGIVPPTGLTYNFYALNRADDSISFSKDGGATWTYTPVPDADGYDAAVTNIRVQLSGNQTAGSNFSLRFRVKLK